MSQNLQQAKQQYNELLKRWKRYENFVENHEISMDEKCRYTEHAKNLTNDLSRQLIEVAKLGYKYSDGEILNGFLI